MDRISTGIEALDTILQGGIPSGSSILIAGTPGTGKTILANQIVFNNASADNKVLYLTTMSEPQVKVIKFQNEFSYFDIEKFQSSVFFYDLSSFIRANEANHILAYIDDLMRHHQPKLVVIDTIKVMDEVIASSIDKRQFILELSTTLSVWDCTTLFLGEYAENEINSRIESAIVDGIILLGGTEEKKYQKRYLRILKMRGTDYSQGETYFKITNNGLVLFPRLNPDINEEDYTRDFSMRVSTGITSLDGMLGGGLPESTITLVSGGAGTGKTVLATHFAYNGLTSGEPVIYATFEENPKQFISSALSKGLDFRPYVLSGQFKLLHISPVELDVDEHIFILQDLVRRMKAKRLVIDSVSSFELGFLDKIKYTDYIFSLTNYLKTMGVTAFLTHELHNSFDVSEFTKHGISFVADNLILLQYKEHDFDIKRYLRVVKSRSSAHKMHLQEFIIDDNGIKLL